MGLLLGIDLGSTSLKAIVFDEAGNIMAKGSVPTVADHLNVEHPQWVYWDPKRLWNGIAEAIRQVVQKLGGAKDIVAVAVDGFGMDGLPLDKEGNWLYPFISWHCGRSYSEMEKLKQKIDPPQLFQQTGKQMLQMDTICRLMWMKEHHPDILEKTDTWILVEDFINHQLCGSKTIDYSMAWCTSAFDLEKKEWIGEVFEKTGIDVSIMPKILPSGSKIGKVTNKAAAETGLQSGTQVILGGHDNICSALALGAFQDDMLIDVTGTWEILINSSSKANTSEEIYRLGLNVESHVTDGKYCMLGSDVSSDMVEWFRTNYGYEEAAAAAGDVVKEWKLLVEKAKNAPVGCNGAVFLPHFSGAGTPNVDDNSAGAFVGLNNLTDKGCMLRAIYEGLTFQMLEMIEVLEIGSGICCDSLVVTGGATKNEFWMQMKADVSGKKVVIPSAEESSALGAAMVAGIGMGIYADAKDAFQKTFQIKKEYYPRKEVHEKYKELYKIYKKIYPALKDVNTEIKKYLNTNDKEEEIG